MIFPIVLIICVVPVFSAIGEFKDLTRLRSGTRYKPSQLHHQPSRSDDSNFETIISGHSPSNNLKVKLSNRVDDSEAQKLSGGTKYAPIYKYKKFKGKQTKLSGDENAVLMPLQSKIQDMKKLWSEYLEKLSTAVDEVNDALVTHSKLSGKLKGKKKHRKNLNTLRSDDNTFIQKLGQELQDIRVLNAVFEKKLSGEDIDLSKLSEAVEEAQLNGDSELIKQLSDEAEDLNDISLGLEKKLSGEEVFLRHSRYNAVPIFPKVPYGGGGRYSGYNIPLLMSGKGSGPEKSRICIMNVVNEYCVGEEYTHK